MCQNHIISFFVIILNRLNLYINSKENGVVKIVITKTNIYCTEDFYYSNVSPNLEKIPPVIGCLISDKDGKSIVSFEIFKGAIQYFMKINTQSHQKEFQIELIPMYVSAIELLSHELNIQGLPGIDINGANLKIKLLFNFKEFNITLFLNPTIDFENIEDLAKTYLANLFEEFNFELNNTELEMEFLNFLERIGLCWLLDLNDEYLRLHQN